MSCVSPGVEGTECWKVGFREWTQGGLAVKRQPEVTGLRAPQPGKFRKVYTKKLGHHRSKASLLSGTEGAGPPFHPLPQPSASASAGTGRDSHQSDPAPV